MCGLFFASGKVEKKAVSYLVSEPFFYSNITGNEYLSLFKNNHFDTRKWNELIHLPLDQKANFLLTS